MSNLRSKSQTNLVCEDETFPKQTNTYDCGLYVILAVTILAENYRNPNCGFTTEEINPMAINSLRVQLRTTIESMYGNGAENMLLLVYKFLCFQQFC